MKPIPLIFLVRTLLAANATIHAQGDGRWFQGQRYLTTIVVTDLKNTLLVKNVSLSDGQKSIYSCHNMWSKRCTGKEACFTLDCPFEIPADYPISNNYQVIASWMDCIKTTGLSTSVCGDQGVIKYGPLSIYSSARVPNLPPSKNKPINDSSKNFHIPGVAIGAIIAALLIILWCGAYFWNRLKDERERRKDARIDMEYYTLPKRPHPVEFRESNQAPWPKQNVTDDFLHAPSSQKRIINYQEPKNIYYGQNLYYAYDHRCDRDPRPYYEYDKHGNRKAMNENEGFFYRDIMGDRNYRS